MEKYEKGSSSSNLIYLYGVVVMTVVALIDNIYWTLYTRQALLKGAVNIVIF